MLAMDSLIGWRELRASRLVPLARAGDMSYTSGRNRFGSAQVEHQEFRLGHFFDGVAQTFAAES